MPDTRRRDSTCRETRDSDAVCRRNLRRSAGVVKSGAGHVPPHAAGRRAQSSFTRETHSESATQKRTTTSPFQPRAAAGSPEDTRSSFRSDVCLSPRAGSADGTEAADWPGERLASTAALSLSAHTSCKRHGVLVQIRRENYPPTRLRHVYCARTLNGLRAVRQKTIRNRATRSRGIGRIAQSVVK